jgi:hypothetical protein
MSAKLISQIFELNSKYLKTKFVNMSDSEDNAAAFGKVVDLSVKKAPDITNVGMDLLTSLV